MTRPDTDTLRRLYVEEGLTTVEIGQQYGRSHRAICRWLEVAGIPLRRPGTRVGTKLPTRLPRPTGAMLHGLYVERNLSATEVGQLLGIHYSTVLEWLREARIPIRSSHRRKTVGEMQGYQRVPLPDSDTFRALYESGMTLKGIGEQYGVTTMVTAKLAKQYGVEMRPAGFNQRSGLRFPCDDGHLVRSSYEMKVCDWLAEHVIEHVYDPPINGLKRADFLANGWYIEVWGLTNPVYVEAKKIKQAWYRANGTPLIELGAHMFEPNRRGLWERRLVKVLSRPSPE